LFVLGLILSLAIGISLGFFGGGGSILTVPLLVYAFGLPPKEAIASSLLVVGIASLSSGLQHARVGNVRLREAMLFGGAGVIGAYLGGRASVFFDGGILLLLFAAMMLLTASAMWRGRRGATRGDPVELHRSPLRLLLQGFVVGMFTGLVGAGGGFLIVPALALWAGLPMNAAVGTSLFIIVLNCTAGFVGYATHVEIDPLLVASVTIVAIAGSFGGAMLATRTDPARLRRAFAGFVLLMGIAILVREGALLTRTLAPALPETWPQVVFALALLGVGIAAGRASKRATRRREDLVFQQGGGI
jgi:uncharacterized membrane protein YfcA